MSEHVPADRIVTQVSIEPKSLVGFYRIRTGVLKLISSDFIDQANTATFLPKIQQYSGSSLCNQLQRHL